MGDVLQQWLILFAQRDPVIAVHVRHIEPVAITPPDFVEDLVPLFGGYPVDSQASGRNRFSAFVSLRCRVKETEARGLSDQNFCTVAGYRITEDVVSDGGFFSILKSKDAKLCRAIALAAVVGSRTDDIEQVTSLSSQPAIVIGAHRHARNSGGDVFKIDY